MVDGVRPHNQAGKNRPFFPPAAKKKTASARWCRGRGRLGRRPGFKATARRPPEIASQLGLPPGVPRGLASRRGSRRPSARTANARAGAMPAPPNSLAGCQAAAAPMKAMGVSRCQQQSRALGGSLRKRVSRWRAFGLRPTFQGPPRRACAARQERRPARAGPHPIRRAGGCASGCASGARHPPLRGTLREPAKQLALLLP